MLARRFEPQFPVALVDKDLGYALALANTVGAEAPLTARVGAIVADARRHGLCDQNLTALAMLYFPAHRP